MPPISGEPPPGIHHLCTSLPVAKSIVSVTGSTAIASGLPPGIWRARTVAQPRPCRGRCSLRHLDAVPGRFPPGWGLACAGHSLLGLGGGRPRDFLAAPVLCLAQGEHARRLKPEAIPVQLGLADEHVVAVIRVDDLDQRAIQPRQVTAQRGLAVVDLGHVVPFVSPARMGGSLSPAHSSRACANSAWASCLLSVCAAGQSSRPAYAGPAVMRTCLPAAVSTCPCFWFRQRTSSSTVDGSGDRERYVR